MSFHGFTKPRCNNRLAARRTWLLRAVWCLLLSAGAVGTAFGQREPVHYFHSSRLPPGTIGPSQLLRGGPLAGRRVLITAGGTQEPIDPVRVLTNRSSGKQGLAVARAALDAGAEVTLIATSGVAPAPVGAEHLVVGTAAEMADAVLHAVPAADVLVMAAAVADFRPAQEASQKIKRAAGPPVLALEPTRDILAAVGRQRQATGRPAVVVGFAAETQNLLDNARHKLESKKLDLLVANDVSAADSGFGVDTNRVTILDARGGAVSLPLLTKADVAEQLVARIVALLAAVADMGSSPGKEGQL